jgi:hypothetical protein
MTPGLQALRGNLEEFAGLAMGLSGRDQTTTVRVGRVVLSIIRDNDTNLDPQPNLQRLLKAPCGYQVPRVMSSAHVLPDAHDRPLSFVLRERALSR